MTLRRIALTTDFSTEARRSYRIARDIAAKVGAEICLVHVAEPLHFTMGLHSLVPRAEYIKGIEARLTEEIQHEAFAGLDVKSKLLEGSPAYACVEQYVNEESVDLVLIASHGHTGLEHALLGSFAERVVQHVSAPVLTFRTRRSASKEKAPEVFAPRRVLVPFDFSNNARGVLPAVRKLHEVYAPSFLFLFAVEPAPAVMSEPLAGAFAAAVHEAADVATREAEKHFKELLGEEISDLNAKSVVTRGFALHEIVAAAKEEDADVIVMSTHGWTGLRHLLIGSVAEKVVRKAPCSVLTVHPGKED